MSHEKDVMGIVTAEWAPPSSYTHLFLHAPSLAELEETVAELARGCPNIEHFTMRIGDERRTMRYAELWSLMKAAV